MKKQILQSCKAVTITTVLLLFDESLSFTNIHSKIPKNYAVLASLECKYPRRHMCSNEKSVNLISKGKKNNIAESTENTRRIFLSSFAKFTTIPFLPSIADAASIDDNRDFVDIVTNSDIGVATRQATVRGAQLADKLDEKWERFSDSLRDKEKCDENTNRRLFDNGFRKDGTRIGNPVLGALCNPVPLKDFDENLARKILQCSENVALRMKNDGYDGNNGGNKAALKGSINEIQALVGPAFQRAAEIKNKEPDTSEQTQKRLLFNEEVYVKTRAFSRFLLQDNLPVAKQKDLANKYELEWGRQLLNSNTEGILDSLSYAKANRVSFVSPFPKLSPEEINDLNYNEDAMFDALGAISVALRTLQDGGLIGNWEISIPVDDFGEVVTIAVDDDITLGAQLLLREQQQKKYSGTIYFAGSSVIGIVRAALWNVGITCGLDSFFLDPSTTKQDIYNPTQLLLNLSNIKNI